MQLKFQNIQFKALFTEMKTEEDVFVLSWSSMAKKVHVPFVINSGSPRTTLGEATLRALRIKESAELPDQMIVTIHGIEDCSLSHVADLKRLKDTGVYEFANPLEMKITLYQTMTNFFDVVKEGKVK